MVFGFGQKQEEEETLQERQHCTDFPCCLLFLITLGCFAAMYARIFTQGNMGKLFHGIDYSGKICGVDDSVKLQPYLYWCSTGVVGGLPTIDMDQPVCVQSCPGASSPVPTGVSLVSATYEVVPICQSVTGRPESMASYKTELVMDRFCLPDPRVYAALADQLSSKSMSDWQTTAMESSSSVIAAWPVLVGAFFVAVFIGYLYLVLLRHCAETLINVSILLCVLGFGVLGVWLIANAGSVSQQVSDSAGAISTLPSSLVDNKDAITKGCGVVCLALSLLSCCLGCCFHHSIQVGAACVEVACDTMFEMPSLLLLPVLKAFIKGALSLVLILGFAELWSLSGVEVDPGGKNPHWTHSQEQNIEIVLYMLVSFWILCFVNALYQFVIAFGVADYYYTPYDHDHEKNVGCCALWDGLYYGLITHGGSLAFGSLLIALCMVLQKMVELAQKQNEAAGDNMVISCLLCCVACCIACCKDTIEYINKNAYIDIAITSDTFCEAAKNALVMVAELGGAMAILNGATFVFTLFGVLLSMIGTAAFTWAMCNQGVFVQQDSEFNVPEPAAPTVVGAILGGLVAFAFMHVFDMTSDTLLYCYGRDLHMGKSTTNAPEALKELVHGGST